MDIKPSRDIAPASNLSLSEKPLKSPLIQVIQDEKDLDMIDQEEEEEDQEEREIDWSFPQTLHDPQDDISMATVSKYGFNNLYQGHGQNIAQVLAHELLDIQDIDSSTISSRRQERLLAEELQFDHDYFMWDSVMNPDIDRLINEYKSPESKALKRIQTCKGQENPPIDTFLVFTEKEQEQMRNLPNKDYLIDEAMEPSIYLGLVDIIFAYCYNKRSCEGEDTVESPWTMCKLSGTLSAFETFTNLHNVLKCCLRRSLAYPLYRCFSLSHKVFSDVIVMFKLGKRALLKALLHMKKSLSMHESMYLIDRIYITDYCIWIQSASTKTISSLASQLNHFEFKRELSDWPLVDLEAEAKQRALEESEQVLEE